MNYRMIFKLWLHEVTRIFLDRLYENEDDMNWFLNTLAAICRTRLREEIKELIFLNRDIPAKSQYIEIIRLNVFMDIFN